MDSHTFGTRHNWPGWFSITCKRRETDIRRTSPVNPASETKKEKRKKRYICNEPLFRFSSSSRPWLGSNLWSSHLLARLLSLFLVGSTGIGAVKRRGNKESLFRHSMRRDHLVIKGSPRPHGKNKQFYSPNNYKYTGLRNQKACIPENPIILTHYPCATSVGRSRYGRQLIPLTIKQQRPWNNKNLISVGNRNISSRLTPFAWVKKQTENPNSNTIHLLYLSQRSLSVSYGMECSAAG